MSKRKLVHLIIVSFLVSFQCSLWHDTSSFSSFLPWKIVYPRLLDEWAVEISFLVLENNRVCDKGGWATPICEGSCMGNWDDSLEEEQPHHSFIPGISKTDQLLGCPQSDSSVELYIQKSLASALPKFLCSAVTFQATTFLQEMMNEYSSNPCLFNNSKFLFSLFYVKLWLQAFGDFAASVLSIRTVPKKGMQPWIIIPDPKEMFINFFLHLSGWKNGEEKLSLEYKLEACQTGFDEFASVYSLSKHILQSSAWRSSL